MSELLAQLKAKRGVIKGKLTRFQTFLEQFKHESDDIDNLQCRIDNASMLLTEFEETQDGIEQFEPSSVQDERSNFEKIYFMTIGKAKGIIRKRLEPIPQVNTAHLDARRISPSLESNMSIKLPTMNVPIFDGSYDKWLTFYDTFEALIENNLELSDVQKFYYLRLSLRDAAAEVIQSLESTAENYRIAWELLKKRFENRKVIVAQHIQLLCDVSPIRKESGAALRHALDSMQRHVRALKLLQASTWDAIVVHLLYEKLDVNTRREWRAETKKNDINTVENFLEFLEDRCSILDVDTYKTNSHKPNYGIDNKSNGQKQFKHANSFVTTNQYTCSYCKDSYRIYACSAFRELSVQKRIGEVKKLKLCLNCLRSHPQKECLLGPCKRCHKRHNTLLHLETETNPEVQQSGTLSDVDTSRGAGGQIQHECMCTTSNKLTACTQDREFNQSYTLLSTANLLIRDNAGKFQTCRALLDSASQINLMTRDLSERLHLPKTKIDMSISGVDRLSLNINYETNTHIKFRYNGFEVGLRFSIIERIVNVMPSVRLDTSALEIPTNLNLADPHYDCPNKIDALLGASIFWDLLCVGQIKLGKNQPTLQKTHLGWVMSGEVPVRMMKPQTVLCCISNEVLHKQLERFWRIEDESVPAAASMDAQICEDHFLKYHRRQDNGPFTVHLPFTRSPDELGDSKNMALRRLHAMERKFVKNPDLRMRYVEFMRQYELLNHMSEVRSTDTVAVGAFYLPHHAFLKESSSTTKLRVVFDASCKATSGSALNDILRIGPTIQQDLFSIVLRFRQYVYVLTADIKQMYRQIDIAEEHRDYQRIFWRENPDEPIRTFRLNTVTYGMASSPYLAIRCLHQVALDHQHMYPETSRIIRRDFYVDDLLTGAHTVQEIHTIKSELTNTLNAAGFTLHKWASNISAISDSESQSALAIGEEVKTLGLLWHPKADELRYRVDEMDCSHRVTKRIILSVVSQIFDPLGLVGPVIVRAKILIQRLWQLKIAWDEAVPQDVYVQWMNYVRQLQAIRRLSIPRMDIVAETSSSEIHGFCDASEVAYGACIYVRSRDNDGVNTVQLLCAKSKVAPLKRISLPRLELCGALMLARLYHK